MVVAIAVVPSAGRAQTATAPAIAFTGSAAAGGVHASIHVPSFPVTDTPVDGGGPTAQVAVDSIGTSTGYAAFPDPGQFALSVPGLVVGLLAGGAAGLPPIKLPSPPGYPLFVASDAGNAPEQSVGSGPYQLSASSHDSASKASATAGFQLSLTGNAALVGSTASLSRSANGGVVATAIADFQGLTVGPLTLGQVKSTATETLDSTGTVTPSTSMEITGLRVGGIPISLGPQGFIAGGPSYPVPINSTLATLLKPSGISMRVLMPQQFPGRVVAPALEITMPFAMPFHIPNLGQLSGTVTLTVGSATAQMSGAVADGGGGPASTAGSPMTGAGSGFTPTAASGPVSAGGGPADGSATPGAAGTPASPVGSPGVSSLSPSLASRNPNRSGNSGQGGSRQASRLLLAATRTLDLRNSYLILVAGAMTALAAAWLIRRMGGQT
jgi:hypothetical protein